jgi:hypothetical protein
MHGSRPASLHLSADSHSAACQVEKGVQTTVFFASFANQVRDLSRIHLVLRNADSAGMPF